MQQWRSRRFFVRNKNVGNERLPACSVKCWQNNKKTWLKCFKSCWRRYKSILRLRNSSHSNPRKNYSKSIFEDSKYRLAISIPEQKAIQVYPNNQHQNFSKFQKRSLHNSVLHEMLMICLFNKFGLIWRPRSIQQRLFENVTSFGPLAEGSRVSQLKNWPRKLDKLLLPVIFKIS